MSMRCDVHEDDPEANEGTTGRKCVPSWTCRWVRVCATPDPSAPTNDGPHWFGGETKHTLRCNQYKRRGAITEVEDPKTEVSFVMLISN